MPLDIVILGPPGAGKGTQGKRVAAQEGIPHINTGDMFRAECAAGTELGERVKAILDSGDLVPDDVTIEVVRARLAQDDTAEGFVLDGFPRTLPQAEALDRVLAELDRGELCAVLDFQVSDELAVERLLGRAAVEGRSDDTPDKIQHRHDVYHEQSEPLVDYYRSRGLLRAIHADRTVEQVSAEVAGRARERETGGLVIIRKSKAEIETMSRAGAVVAKTLALLGDLAKPGVTTADLDEAAETYIRSEGGVPTFKGYRGFPAAICTSPNSMVVHGIPGAYELKDGDLISVDVGVTLDGFVADSAFTYPVGEVGGDAERLLEVGQAALAAGIAQARAGNHVQDISAAVQRTTEEAGFSVVRSLVGHGIGRSMHEDPQVPNFGEPGRGPLLQPGMTLAIEPMINAGSPDVWMADDRWSISTDDDSLSAHFEHTVAITDNGPLVLTKTESK